MPELRWTLLIIGVLFIVILAWWERRRPHQASRQAPHISGDPRPVVNNDPSWGPDIESANPRPGPHAHREPALILPEIRTEVRGREPTSPRELPVVEIPAGSPIGLHADNGEDDEEAIAAEGAGMAARAIRENRPGPMTSRRMPAQEEAEEAKEAIAEEAEAEELAVPVVESMSVDDDDDDADAEADAEAHAQADGEAHAQADTVKPSGSPELSAPPPTLTIVRPIVDWPPEDQRKLLSLRLVARPPERFRGNLVRQALAAEGFVLGDLDIFHKPDAQNRAVLSAASLTKPGTFELDTMDTQRYVGLNLFAVLPGPKTPQKAFEDLLLTARMLNERLEGALQDERGGPLTPTRIQALRDAVGAEAKS
jgi:cell division protein ZipA